MNRRQSIISLVCGMFAGLFSWKRAVAVDRPSVAWNPCFDETVRKFAEQCRSFDTKVSRMYRHPQQWNLNVAVQYDRYMANFEGPHFSKQELIEYISSIRVPEGFRIAKADAWINHETRFWKAKYGFEIAVEASNKPNRDWHIAEEWYDENAKKIVNRDCYLGDEFCRFVV